MGNLFLELLNMDFPNLRKHRVSGSVQNVCGLAGGNVSRVKKTRRTGFDWFYCWSWSVPSFPWKYGAQLKVFYGESYFFSDLSVDLLKNLVPNLCCLKTKAQPNFFQSLQKLAIWNSLICILMNWMKMMIFMMMSIVPACYRLWTRSRRLPILL